MLRENLSMRTNKRGFVSERARRALLPLLGAAMAALPACAGAPRAGEALVRSGDEISVCGYLFHTGARVILWNDPGGFDAYRPHRRFSDETGPVEVPERVARFGKFRGGLPEEIAKRLAQEGWALQDLRKVVDRVVVHFDACGASERCFEVLHDIRGLSCHFLLDVDGTIYQTLDVKERAWHAAALNDRSVGIEIAHIGAQEDRAVLDEWYIEDEGGLRVNPEKLEPYHPRKLVARPATAELRTATIHGHTVMQYDYTEPQYRALEKLLVTLCAVLPNIPPTVPRDPDGEIVPGLIDFENAGPGSDAGIIGHFHGSTDKVDPGPAFDWDRIEKALKEAEE
jgi:N-acetyl-anhydromuramyl-L-alanine amidase AmpD